MWNHSETTEFIDGLFSNMLRPLITKPTRLTSYSATLIDNILTNNIFPNALDGLFGNDISDSYQSSL